jgi:hypothetical protein
MSFSTKSSRKIRKAIDNMDEIVSRGTPLPQPGQSFACVMMIPKHELATSDELKGNERFERVQFALNVLACFPMESMAHDYCRKVMEIYPYFDIHVLPTNQFRAFPPAAANSDFVYQEQTLNDIFQSYKAGLEENAKMFEGRVVTEAPADAVVIEAQN